MLVRAILRYLVDHPEAKDTVEGILTCWLPREGVEGAEAEVRSVMDELVLQGLLQARAIGRSDQRLYWLDQTRLPDVRALLGEEVSSE